MDQQAEPCAVRLIRRNGSGWLPRTVPAEETRSHSVRSPRSRHPRSGPRDVENAYPGADVIRISRLTSGRTATCRCPSPGPSSGPGFEAAAGSGLRSGMTHPLDGQQRREDASLHSAPFAKGDASQILAVHRGECVMHGAELLHTFEDDRLGAESDDRSGAHCGQIGQGCRFFCGRFILFHDGRTSAHPIR